MRLILGLDAPTSGSVTVGGLLEARAVHTSRSAYDHLRALAATHAIPKGRVHEVIDCTR